MEKEKGKRKGSKQHSEIPTSTPMKEASEMKKTPKGTKIEKGKEKEKRKASTDLKKKITLKTVQKTQETSRRIEKNV